MKQKTGYRTLSWLLVLAMILSLVPASSLTAHAEAKDWTYSITSGGEYTCPATLTDASYISGGTASDPVIIKINGSVTASRTDLPAFVVKNGYVNIVGTNNASITTNSFVVCSNQMGKNKPNGDAVITVKDVVVNPKTGKSLNYVQYYTSTTKCTGNFENVTFKDWSYANSGALILWTNAPQTFTNCTFENLSGAAAGAISLSSGANATLTDCTFKNCTATGASGRYGGGAIEVRSTSKLTLDNCTFQSCTAPCGAVGFENTATVTLKGNTQITGNTSGNLYLPTGATFKVDEDFTGTVGVTTQTAPTESVDVSLSSSLADTQSALANNHIVSDNAAYSVKYKNNSLSLIYGKENTGTYADYLPAATDDATALAAKVVKFNGMDWYLIEDNSTSETEGTVTLLAKDKIGSSRFDNSKNVYSESVVKSYLDKLTAEGGAFADVADAIVSTDLEDVTVTGAKLWLLSNDEVITTYKLSTALNKCSNDWWLRTPVGPSYVVYVNGESGSVVDTGNFYMNTYGVRPALQLDLSKVEFDSETNTFAVPTPPHTHNFTYSASGATITATCSADGCDLTDGKVSFTLVAPAAGEAGLVYDGTDKKATLEGVDAFNVATGLNVSADDIVYNDLTNVVTETKNAGTYQALYTLQTDFPRPFVGITFTIAKADPTYTTPTGLTAAYGDTLSSVNLPTGWSWADGTQSVGGLGTNTFKVNFTPADTNNYNVISEVEVTVTVGKAAGKTASISTDTMSYGSDSIYIEGVAGQEYVIVPKGTTVTDADWNTSVKPDPERENWVFFEDLKAATEYEIYTRTAETENTLASEAVKIDVATPLSSIGYNYDSTLTGASISVEPEPATEGLTYKWYYDEVTEDGEGAIHHNLTEIPGATGSTYFFRKEDAGKHIAVKIFAGDSEVGDVSTDAPVELTAKVIFESSGGSDVETLTGVKYRSKIESPEDPVRMGYAFAGWYWEEELETPFDFENDVITWNETTLYAKWTPVDYSIVSVTGLSGADEKQWTKGTEDGVVITVKVSGEDDSFDHFTGVKLDGKELVRDVDYTVEKGSTIVTLKPETLEKLETGEHTVTILFNNGEVNTTLTVLAAASPKSTGDNSYLGLWIALMLISLCGIDAALLSGKKKRAAGKN